MHSVVQYFRRAYRRRPNIRTLFKQYIFLAEQKFVIKRKKYELVQYYRIHNEFLKKFVQVNTFHYNFQEFIWYFYPFSFYQFGIYVCTLKKAFPLIQKVEYMYNCVYMEVRKLCIPSQVIEMLLTCVSYSGRAIIKIELLKIVVLICK